MTSYSLIGWLYLRVCTYSQSSGGSRILEGGGGAIFWKREGGGGTGGAMLPVNGFASPPVSVNFWSDNAGLFYVFTIRYCPDGLWGNRNIFFQEPSWAWPPLAAKVLRLEICGTNKISKPLVPWKRSFSNQNCIFEWRKFDVYYRYSISNSINFPKWVSSVFVFWKILLYEIGTNKE